MKLNSPGTHRLRLFTVLRDLVVAVVMLGILRSAHGAALEVGTVRLTVENLDRELKFYTEVLPFQRMNNERAQGAEIERLTGIPGARTKTVTLKLGDERIALTEFVTPKGRAIPADSRSYDHWFQHIAIVVRDMDQAYEILRRHKVAHVSTAPQKLPEWNQGAAGIRAFYFRDPEDHVLEIIYFPPGKGDPKWQVPAEGLFLGIDHTAIVVSDSDRSLAFYRDTLGMRVAGEGENYGPEQERLNQVFGARLRITALRAARGPGIEFLEYIAPPGGRPLPADARANDLVFWHTDIIVDHNSTVITMLQQHQVKIVSLTGRGESVVPEFIARDPDGHALKFVEAPRRSASAPVR